MAENKPRKKMNVNVEHLVKQKKRKDLSNEYVYASHDGIVEMFPIKDVCIGKKPLGEIIEGLYEANTKVNKRLDNVKKINKTLLDRIKKIEGKLKRYGLE